jgi:RHS repeat-associated protein
VDLSGSAAHKLVTKYKHNSLNKVVWQKTPDAGESEYWYNSVLQLRMSRNAQQRKDNNYSYTKFDNQGRVKEIGEVNTTIAQNDVITLLLTDNTFPTASASYILSDVTKTYYDLANSGISASLAQQYLRSKISWVEVYEKGASDVIATYYSYDIHGNVKSMLQQIPGLPNKRIDYRYDLISGNVSYVFYQYGQSDQFIHRYKYDTDNRLTFVATSTDGFMWENEAAYKYYLHGSLARIELGHYRDEKGGPAVQGLDYYYTLQGWIKGVNMPYAGDPGNDGNSGSVNKFTGRDAFAYALGYFHKDYLPRNTAKVRTDSRDKLWSRVNTMYGHLGMYNGNISWMSTELKKIGQDKGARWKGMQGMIYQYDQLNRIVKTRSHTIYKTTGYDPRLETTASPYDEDFSYDANGNFLTLKRKDNTGVLTDDLNYQYYANSNRLRYSSALPDIIYTGNIVQPDRIYRNITIKNTANVATGSDVTLKAVNNISFENGFNLNDNARLRAYVLTEDEGEFMYDANGSLVWDQHMSVKVEWTPFYKARKVTRQDGTVTTFRYDGAGNRIEKKTTLTDNSTTITRYVRGPGGEVLGIYDGTALSELPIYSASRIGQYKGGRLNGVHKLGLKSYELSNHLGNVLTVVSDNIRTKSDTTWATVLSARDYYAFGLDMPGRNFDLPGQLAYKYGFNGKEKLQGEFNDAGYDFDNRVYNARIGRFLSTDPLAGKTPYYSPYLFGGNKPIVAIDWNGLQEIVIHVFRRYEDGHEEFVESYKISVRTGEEVRGIYRGTLEVKVVQYNTTEYDGRGGSTAYTAVDIQYKARTGLTRGESMKYGPNDEMTFVSLLKYYSYKAMYDNPLGTGHFFAAMNGQDGSTGEHLSRWGRVMEIVDGLVSTASLASGGTSQALKSALKSWAVDFGVEQVFEMMDAPQALLFAYYATKFAHEGRQKQFKNILDKITKLAGLGVEADKLIQTLKDEHGIDLTIPLDNEEAVKSFIKDKNLGEIPTKGKKKKG